jgi:hypothetical protein
LPRNGLNPGGGRTGKRKMLPESIYEKEGSHGQKTSAEDHRTQEA